MPTYEYACPSCKKSYETREGFDAPSTHTCQRCGKGRAKRVLHAPRVVFKGNGFYSTDSRSKSTAHVDDSEPSPNGAKSGAEKKESTSDTKSETKAGKATETSTAG
ncbi:MAG: FmdB family zinc ribbon protein [Dehalococcoidia bacterium]